MARVAFFTFGVMREPWGHPAVRGFEDRIDAAFATAREVPGFIALPAAMFVESADEMTWPAFGPAIPQREDLCDNLTDHRRA